MTSSPNSPQIRVDQISVAPQLFKSAQLSGRKQSLLPAHYVLRELSFEVFQDDRVAIVGASGSGKTFLLRLLNRLISPTQGALYLNDRPYSEIPAVSLRQQVLLLPKEAKLLGMTVQDALAYPLRLRGISAKARAIRVAEACDRWQIPSDWLHRTEQQLSVEERQWVAIVRAMIAQPQVLLLDDPTAALDINQRDQFLATLTQESGSLPTVFMVTDQLDIAEAWCSRVLQLQQGQLITDQPADRVNWQTLQETLEQAALADAEEWQ